MPTFDDLMTRHVGLAYAKQLGLADHIGDRDWAVDLDAGTITFGDDLRYRAQILGTQADDSDTWLWAWGNTASGWPDSATKASRELKAYGEKHKIEELTGRTFSIDVADGHSVAIVASGLFPKACYYRGPYDGGAAFLLVIGAPADVIGPFPLLRITTVIPQIVSGWELDHRDMCESFLKSQGFALESTPTETIAKRGTEQLELAFDPSRRLTELSTTLSK